MFTNWILHSTKMRARNKKYYSSWCHDFVIQCLFILETFAFRTKIRQVLIVISNENTCYLICEDNPCLRNLWKGSS